MSPVLESNRVNESVAPLNCTVANGPWALGHGRAHVLVAGDRQERECDNCEHGFGVQVQFHATQIDTAHSPRALTVPRRGRL
jgi:uncharacterized Zn-finger protein